MKWNHLRLDCRIYSLGKEKRGWSGIGLQADPGLASRPRGQRPIPLVAAYDVNKFSRRYDLSSMGQMSQTLSRDSPNKRSIFVPPSSPFHTWASPRSAGDQTGRFGNGIDTSSYCELILCWMNISHPFWQTSIHSWSNNSIFHLWCGLIQEGKEFRVRK